MTESSESIIAIAEALAAFQGDMEAPQRTKTAKVRGETNSGKAYEYEYQYAPLEEITRVIKEPLSKHGLSWRQGVIPGQQLMAVRTYVMHKSGEWFVSDYPVQPFKPGHQGLASGVSYARRYGLTLALGIAAEDDDDANVADAQPVATQSRASAPATRGATRAAAPRQPAPPPVAAAGNGHATGDPARPKWIEDFLARDTYEIDPAKAGGWSAWEKAYSSICVHADDIDQVIKLEQDNGAHFTGFRTNVKDIVYEAFRARVEAAEKRLWRAPDTSVMDAS